MAELVLIAEIDNGKNLDMDEIKQTLEQFNNKVGDINRFNEPVDAEKWEYLNHYYIKPLNQEVQEISEKWLDLEV